MLEWLVFLFQLGLSEEAELKLKFQRMGLTEVPQGINPDVTELYLHTNLITRLENDSLTQLIHLKFLDMGYNRLTYVGNLAFANNKKLYRVHLDGNSLSTISPVFWGASRWIEIFIFSWNNQPVEKSVFHNFPKLKKIGMVESPVASGNLDLQNLPNLTSIMAKGCQLTIFPNLSEAPSLDSTSLHYNAFTEIPQSTIQGLHMLRKFAIAGCPISHLPDMSHMTSLEELIVNGTHLAALPDLYHLPLSKLFWAKNPMECNQDLCWVRMWDYMKPSLVTNVNSNDDLTCAAPLKMAGRPWLDIHPIELGCFNGKLLRTPLSKWHNFNSSKDKKSR